jgi:hypothetical protein
MDEKRVSPGFRRQAAYFFGFASTTVVIRPVSM